jgi:hypothetical protein
MINCKRTDAMTPTSSILAAFTPTGKLRAAINLGNPILAAACLRLLDGRFMLIQQAISTPTSRGGEAAAFLAGFVEEMKARGFVAAALARHRISGASVPPPVA